jgi:hypothetical protein
MNRSGRTGAGRPNGRRAQEEHEHVERTRDGAVAMSPLVR